ncbi:HD domain-containing protein [Mobilitalea sibirica]|uniref:HD domain-containing protein n=1 Tax=Mobilitalea sibirica TaxID=1462919 RepID=A0A8J7HB41_9FIRM|nr:HD domain-containing protein [Mobilitalea sibirica]MBH1940661.1 HD domain-containing protein [Mobilitalea sibirica]
MITFKDIKQNEAIKTYIKKADEALAALGYTDHSLAHVSKVAEIAGYILQTLNYSDREIELAKIAGYMHDIGNVVNRDDHAQSGAVMAFRLLDQLGVSPEEISTIISAIGNHDEGTAVPVNPIAAALILADKTDVRRSRVRNRDLATFDIHDRVNYAVEKSEVDISSDKKAFRLILTIDTSISPVMDYFEIFMGRMLLCKKAANRLDMRFELIINNQKVL